MGVGVGVGVVALAVRCANLQVHTSGMHVRVPALTRRMQVEAQCRVRGRYAQDGPDNWPAQVIICGDPPGSSSCGSAVYNASLPTILPGMAGNGS